MRQQIQDTWRKWRALWKGRRWAANIIQTRVYFSENRAATVWGGISEQEERGLREAVARSAAFDGPIVEIGTLFGWTAQLIASMKAPEKELIAVDNFSWNPFCVPPDDHRVITRRTLAYCLEHCRTRIFDGTSREFYDSYQGPTPSMVFIDGDHSYAGVQADIAWACERGVPVVAGHDYNTRLHRGVVRAVDEQFAGRFELVGALWIASGQSRSMAA